jgi:hypothetical protein
VFEHLRSWKRQFNFEVFIIFVVQSTVPFNASSNFLLVIISARFVIEKRTIFIVHLNTCYRVREKVFIWVFYYSGRIWWHIRAPLVIQHNFGLASLRRHCARLRKPFILKDLVKRDLLIVLGLHIVLFLRLLPDVGSYSAAQILLANCLGLNAFYCLNLIATFRTFMKLIETLLLRLGHMKIVSLLMIQLLPFITFIL